MWIVHDTDGRILSVINHTPEWSYVDMAIEYGPYVLSVIDTPDAKNEYVSGNSVVPKVAILAVWDTQVITTQNTAMLTGLPVPCTLSIDGELVIVSDGSLEFSAFTEGDFLIILDEAAYLKEEWIISVD